jgi:hypothetical protein
MDKTVLNNKILCLLPILIFSSASREGDQLFSTENLLLETDFRLFSPVVEPPRLMEYMHSRFRVPKTFVEAVENLEERKLSTIFIFHYVEFFKDSFQSRTIVAPLQETNNEIVNSFLILRRNNFSARCIITVMYQQFGVATDLYGAYNYFCDNGFDGNFIDDYIDFCYLPSSIYMI